MTDNEFIYYSKSKIGDIISGMGSAVAKKLNSKGNYCQPSSGEGYNSCVLYLLFGGNNKETNSIHGRGG